MPHTCKGVLSPCRRCSMGVVIIVYGVLYISMGVVIIVYGVLYISMVHGDYSVWCVVY
jgi:hypothetical protein